jgi:hypothetical protein
VLSQQALGRILQQPPTPMAVASDGNKPFASTIGKATIAILYYDKRAIIFPLPSQIKVSRTGVLRPTKILSN